MEATLSRGVRHGLAALAALAVLLGAPPRLAAQDGPRKQQIAFAELPPRTVGDAPFELAAKASSGLKVVLTVIEGPAVLDGKVLRLTGLPGLVVVRATQDGSTAFAPATPVVRAFTVNPSPAAPVFTSAPRSAEAEIGSMVELSAAATGVPAPSLQWRRDGEPLQGATGRALMIPAAGLSDAGTYDVVATNPSGSATSPKAQVTVVKRRQFLSFQGASALTAGQPYSLTANASSGLQVRFTVVSGTAILYGAVMTPQAGTVVVQASQEGDATYAAAAPVSQTFTVGLSQAGQRLP
jgi:hypothetical protein